MPLSLPNPTIMTVVDELMGFVRSDVAGGSSLINAQLPTGVTFDPATLATETDLGSYRQVKVGDRTALPRGLSMFYLTEEVDPTWEYSPNGLLDTYLLRIRWVWDDTASKALTDTLDLYHRMMANLAQALAVVLGPTNLGAGPTGFWTLTGGGKVRDPRAILLRPGGALRMANRENVTLYSEILWRCRHEYTP